MEKVVSDSKRIKTEDLMQRGYEESIKGNAVVACDLWIELWEHIQSLITENNFRSIEEVENALQERYVIFNWAPDFEAELLNAGIQDKRYIELRMEFCREYIYLTQAKNDLNTLNMRRAIADSLYELDKSNEGDQEYRNLLKAYPKYGWGWIGWSDQYWTFSKPDHKDSDKAIHILKEALKVTDLEDRWEVVDRLKSIYKDLDMKNEADALKYPEGKPTDMSTDMSFADGMLNMAKDKQKVSNQTKQQPFVSGKKIGRNDPCPCGSGKKYKKCCGRNSI